MSEDSSTYSVTRLFRLFGENAAAITLVCTAFSLIVNFFRFRQWGLDYASVITPSDIIVGGIDAFSLLLPFFIAAMFGILAGRRSREIFTSKKARSIIAFVTAIPIMVWVVFFPWRFDGSTEDGLIWYFSYTFALMFWFEALAVSREQIFIKADSEIAFIGNFGLVFSTILSIFVVFNLHDLAMEGDTTLITSERCDARESVVWMGTESVVTTCEIDKAPLERDYFIVERNGLEFIVSD
ncbi:hypothetical protein [Erythrobacter rubeus]|uniref:Uncharacterized protein n=1 Tax=Erythrobacter rubeus TaxID=2760803 RepID=A0ABR8KM96_9SPHN|nr:hypothetical protein [Erythrobacter rubeus]MBD2840764.1 hypothetical protein [Erythrobacter rubeus]